MGVAMVASAAPTAQGMSLSTLKLIIIFYIMIFAFIFHNQRLIIADAKCTRT